MHVYDHGTMRLKSRRAMEDQLQLPEFGMVDVGFASAKSETVNFAQTWSFSWPI